MSSYSTRSRRIVVSLVIATAIIAAVLFGAVTRAEYGPASLFMPAPAVAKSEITAMPSQVEPERQKPGVLKLRSGNEITVRGGSSGGSRVAAAADFNADGIGDVVVAYNGSLAVYSGDLNAFAPQTNEAWEAIRDGRFISPFEADAKMLSVPVAADFLQTGDFNRDTYIDIAFAARGGELFVFDGDGKGGFSNLRSIGINGTVTALAAGDVNRFDGLPDLIVGVSGTNGPELQIFQGLGDVFASASQIEPLRSSAVSIALGQLNDNSFGDIAVASDSEVTILSGKDISTSEEARPNISLPLAGVRSIVSGDFMPDREARTELAVLSGDGTIRIFARGSLDTRPVTQNEHLADQVREYQSKGYPVPERILAKLTKAELRAPLARAHGDVSTWGEAETVRSTAPDSRLSPQSILTTGRLSDGATEDLITIDQGNGKVTVMPFVTDYSGLDPQATRIGFEGKRTSETFDVAGSPVAALAMKLDYDTNQDLLVLRSDNGMPSVLLGEAPLATFVVNSATDAIDANIGNGVCATSGAVCTLRAAIMEANRLPGNDTIMINPGINPTISLGQPDNDGQGTNDQNTGDLDITCVISSPAFGACDLPIATNQNDLTIVGAAGGNTVSAGTFTPYPVNGGGTINTDRVFDIGSDGTTGGGFGGSTGITAIFSNLTIQNGWVREAWNTGLGGGNFAFGGGIRFDGFGNGGAHGSFTLTNTTVTNNQSDNAGAGVMHRYGQLIGNGATAFSSNIVHAGDGGGGVWFGAATSISSLSITGCTFNANQAQQGSVFGGLVSGGDGGGLWYGNSSNSPTVTNTNFTNNISQKNGGAIKGQDGMQTVSGGSITGNTARGHGGGIYADTSVFGGPDFLTVTGSTLRNNTANSDNAGTGLAAGAGGAIFRDRGVLNITNAIIGGTGASEPNTATDGGGVAHFFTVDTAGANDSNRTTVNINGGSIVGNNATANGTSVGNNGGGIYFDSALFDVTASALNIGQTGSTPITSNRAENHGGGLYISNGAVAILNNMAIRSNQANSDTSGGGDGGAIYQNLGTTTFTGTLIIGGATFANTAVNGGGIRNNAGTVNIPNAATISNNTATGNGGGISNAGTLSALSTSTFTSNTATGNGGAIHNTGTLGAITSPLLTSNSAAASGGGGIFSSNGPLSVTNGGISNNTGGGGIAHSGTSASTVSGVTIGGNTGHGILISGTGSLDAASNTITNNTLDGIAMTGTGLGSHFNSNTIHTNGELGIDLGDNGVTLNDANDADTGPNNLQNFPVLNYVRRGDGVANVTLNAPNGKYRIQYYANTACDPSGHGEGESLKASQVVDIVSGNTLTFFSPALAYGAMEQITATATHDANGNNNFDDDGSTSEFSACRKVNTLPTITPQAGNTRQQGSPVSNTQIGVVADPDQTLNTLVVTVNGGASATVNGVTLSNIVVSAGGFVTADIVASCTATNATFTLRVTDNATEFNEATLAVSVTPNTPPTLGTYGNTLVNAGSSGTVVTPSAAPTDNGNVATLTAAAPGFTGTFVGNTTSGAITVNNAGPFGVYTVTVTATDNCGATTTSTFQLTVNALPTITGATISRQQGSPSANSQIATVNDNDQAENTLVVTVNGGAAATVNGVTVSNIVVDVSGNVTADVVASCTATNATFTLTVTDANSASANATLIVNVTLNTPPTQGTYPNTSTAPGSNTTVTPSAPPTDNGSVATLTASAPGFAGIFSGNTTTGVITVTNASPVGVYTVTVTATDNCGATSTRTFQLTVNNPPTITAIPTSRNQGAPVSNSQIATVDDLDQTENTLGVTVNGGPTATVNNVTVSNIVVAANGSVTADVVAPAGSSDASFTLTVTDSVGATATATLNVTVITCVTPPLNMIAWYTGDGTPRDIAGGNDGSLVGGATYGAGKVGQAFSFPTNPSYINRAAGSPSPLNLTGTAVTIDGWINPTTTTAAVYFGKTASGSNDYLLLNPFGSQVQALVRTSTGETGINAFADFPTNTVPYLPALGVWTHLAMTYDGTTVKIYANGLQIGSGAKTGNLSGSNVPFNIGGRSQPGLQFNGFIDEVEVFNRALLQSEIQSIVAADGGGKCKPFDLRIDKEDVNAPFDEGAAESYTIVVTNDGPATTGGTTTVSDTLPAGITPGAATGTNWTCNTTSQLVTCTSTQAVTAGNVFPTITVPVTVAQNAAPSVSNTATVATSPTTGEMDTSDNSDIEVTPVTAIAQTPLVTNATTNEDTQTTSGLVISRHATDGAEVTHFKITAITNGTLFQNNGTTPIANNEFITFAQGNAGLKFTPNANFFGSGSFTVQASISNADGGIGGGPATATITVNAVADTPSVTNATTNEDVQTTSGLVISRNAGDGAEVSHFKITAITNGTLFQTDGTTAIPANSFITVAQGNAGLKFTPTANFFGSGTFQIQASTSNADAGLGGGVITATITVNTVADTPSVTNATTNEDTQTTSGLVISRNAADGVEVTHFKITAITNGTLFQSDGTTPIASSSFITVAQGNAGLKFTPAANFFGNGSFQVQASLSNADAGLGGSVITATITVAAVADTPSVTNATTNEDVQTTSGLVISRNAGDGAEVTHFQITGITNGTLFLNDGVTAIANNAFITFAQGSAGLKFTPTANFFGSGSFQVQSSLSNGVGGLGGGLATATITVNAIADTPSVTNATTNEDTQTTSGLVISRNAADAAEVTHFKITALTNGTLFQSDGTTPIANNAFITVAQGNAGLKFTPNANFFGSGSFQIQASTSNADAGLGGAVITATITVNAVADTPSVTNATTNEDIQTTSGLVISRNAADGAEVTHFKITAITNGSLFLNDGTTPVTNNTFITFAQGNAGLKFTPTANFFGSGTFQIQASVSSVDGGLGGAVITATITVNAVADTPSVTNATTPHFTQTTSGLVISRNPADGAEVTHFKITNIQNGTLFQNDGLTPIANNAFITFAQGNAGLRFTPNFGFLGTATFDIQASLSNVDGGLGGSVITANITVTCIANPIVQNNANAGIGSLRQAVGGVCPGDTITFNMATVVSPISLSGGQITLTRNMTIQGPVAGTLTVQNAAAASPTSRVFSVNGGVSATVSGLRMTGGNTSTANGGAINNDGTLTLTNTVITANNAGSTTAFGGGGIASQGTLNLNSSTVSNNTSMGGGGGLLMINGGTTTITASTFSGNTGNSAGAILAQSITPGGLPGSLIVNKSTISGNTAIPGTPCGGIWVLGTLSTAAITSTTITNNAGTFAGGLCSAGGPITVRNSIIAGNVNNTTVPDIDNPVTSQGFNLIGSCPAACAASGFTAATDQSGTLAAPLNPQISALANNGGPTFTHALLSTSPAVDKGDDGSVPATTDQRGELRPFDIPSIAPATGGDNSDIGAYELNTIPTSTALASSANPSVFGQNVTFTATVSTVPSGGPVIGDVDFSFDGVPVAACQNVALVANQATCSTAALSVGAHTIYAEFDENLPFLASNATITQNVNKANTTTTVTAAPPSPSTFGQSVTFTATVAAAPPGAGTPTGTVTFNIDGNIYCPNTPLTNQGGFQRANCTQAGLPALPAGVRNVVAIYNGDANFNGSAGTLNYTVNKANTTTAIVSDDPDPSLVNQPYTVTWTVTAVAPGAGTPVGTVTVNGGAGGGTCTAPATSGGCQLTPTTIGAKTIQATFNGDANFNGSASATTTHTVNVGISGTVRNGLTLAPVPGVTMGLYQMPAGTFITSTTTNAAGLYTFAGNYTAPLAVQPTVLNPPYYDPQFRYIASLATNVTGQDFLQYGTIPDIPRTLSMVTQYVVPGAAGSMPFILNAQGNEASVSFSISYDINPLAQPPVFVCGADAPLCTITNNTSVLGRVGVTIVPAGGTFGTGLKEIARMNFQTVATPVIPSTPITFQSSPVAFSIVDAGNNPLLTVISSRSIVFAIGNEGDVAGRNSGSGTFEAADVVQMRRFVTGLDVPLVNTFNEFQRADTSPASTTGDGVLDATDLVQARRYVAGLDAARSAGGAGFPNPAPAPPPVMERVSEITIGKANATNNTRVSLPIDLAANGTETAASFAIRYDESRLDNPTVELAANAPEGITLTFNKETPGVIRVLIDSPNAIEAKAATLLNITFDVRANAPSGDALIEVEGLVFSDQEARATRTQATMGTISIAGPNPAVEDLGAKARDREQRAKNKVTLPDNDLIDHWLNRSTIVLKRPID